MLKETLKRSERQCLCLWLRQNLCLKCWLQETKNLCCFQRGKAI